MLRFIIFEYPFQPVLNLNREVKRFCVDKIGTVSNEMNSGALQASHRSEQENETYNDIPTKIAGKCGFYSIVVYYFESIIRIYPSSNSFNGKLFSKS